MITRAGLTPHEAKIYLHLVQQGPGTVSDISTHTGLHRPTVYKHIPALEEKGLITISAKGKRTVYASESPEKLSHLFQEVETEFQRSMPGLVDIFHKQKNKPLMRFYEGKRGIASVFDDILLTLKRGEIFYRYSSKTEPMSDAYLPRDYRKRRDAKKLERFVIANTSYQKKKKPRLERQIKVVPEDTEPFGEEVTLMIYADRIAVIDFNTDTAFIVENPALARFHIFLFKLMYSRL